MSSSYDRAKAAIDNMFGDTSVAPGKTKANLVALSEHIDMLIDTITDEPTDEDAE